MSDSGRTIGDELDDFGIAVVGDIDLELVEKVKAHLEPPDVKQRHHRQTELWWNSACGAVVKDFEIVSEKPKYIYCPDRIIETKTEYYAAVRKAISDRKIYVLSRIPITF
jgi:hypothetical protein